MRQCACCVGGGWGLMQRGEGEEGVVAYDMGVGGNNPERSENGICSYLRCSHFLFI